MKMAGRRVAFLCFTGLGLTGLAWASPASAVSWIDCNGQAVSTTAGKAEPETSPAHDIYVLDDSIKGLFKYSPTRKMLDPEPVTAYDDKEIRWAQKPQLGALDAGWEGRLDRVALSLRIDYRKGPETTVWTEQCKPTDAQPTPSADATPNGKPPG
jgi:hypothetical protein